MIGDEQRARIRRLFFAEHWKVGTIAEQLGVHHDTVRRAIGAASETLVRIVDVDREVARHARSYDRGRKIEDRTHLDQLAADKRRASELRGRDRLTSACSRAGALLEQVAVRGGHLGGTTTRLLHLLDREGAQALDAAIGEALSRGAASAEAVAHVLDQQRRAKNAPPLVDVILPDDPRVRDVRVTPHSLASYDDALRGAARGRTNDE